jgi:Flp pilus assembly protein TadG
MLKLFDTTPTANFSCSSKALKPARAWMSRFCRDETGSMSYVAVAGALIMMVFGGIGIDLIHTELQRNKVQNTLDRAVLAAANLNHETAPEDMVEEYFRAMGMSDALDSVSVEDRLNYKQVTAEGSLQTQANFLSLLGVDTLQALGSATAEHGLNKIEVSLVLDISGSMSGTKINQMKDAANTFIDLMLGPDAGGLTTISVIPYNATVNMGDLLAAQYTLEDYQTYSNCATFAESDYTTTAIDTTQEIAKIAHFDPYSSSTSSTAISRPWCQTGQTAAIMAHSSDADALKSHIASLSAGGNTAIDLGMKWGVGLLDPSTQPAISALAADGHVDGSLGIRPAAYSDGETLKFVVVMTDGENTTQYDLKTSKKYGLSDIWIDERNNSNPSDDRFSLRVSSNQYYQLRRDRYRSNPDGGARARQMTYAEVYARFGTRAVASKFYYEPYRDGRVSYNTYRDFYYSYQATVDGNRADDQLSAVCQAARNNSVVVYAIGVEAPQRGLDAMHDCASSPAHYFDVTGSELEDTFNAIARSLQQLRLTQ